VHGHQLAAAPGVEAGREIEHGDVNRRETVPGVLDQARASSPSTGRTIAPGDRAGRPVTAIEASPGRPCRAPSSSAGQLAEHVTGRPGPATSPPAAPVIGPAAVEHGRTIAPGDPCCSSPPWRR